ncbi:MAG TPA: hypothetical protein PKC30_13650 [Saprospiraceae bacterium]|nr:hypothetical protein [Saprospiraceae bacterium]
MPVYYSMREAMVWVQWDRSAETYQMWKVVNETLWQGQSQPVYTNENNENIAYLIATGLEPGNTYEYAIVVDEEMILKKHRR